MVWIVAIRNHTFKEAKIINHSGDSEDVVVPPNSDVDYNYSIGATGKGIEVEYFCRDEKRAVMIVDEDWRLKFSHAVVHGESKSFTPYGQLKVLKHYAEIDIFVSDINGGELSVRDVSKPTAWEVLNKETGFGLELDPEDRSSYFRFYAIDIN